MWVYVYLTNVFTIYKNRYYNFCFDLPATRDIVVLLGDIWYHKIFIAKCNLTTDSFAKRNDSMLRGFASKLCQFQFFKLSFSQPKSALLVACVFKCKVAPLAKCSHQEVDFRIWIGPRRGQSLLPCSSGVCCKYWGMMAGMSANKLASRWNLHVAPRWSVRLLTPARRRPPAAAHQRRRPPPPAAGCRT